MTHLIFYQWIKWNEDIEIIQMKIDLNDLPQKKLLCDIKFIESISSCPQNHVNSSIEMIEWPSMSCNSRSFWFVEKKFTRQFVLFLWLNQNGTLTRRQLCTEMMERIIWTKHTRMSHWLMQIQFQISIDSVRRAFFPSSNIRKCWFHTTICLRYSQLWVAQLILHMFPGRNDE